MRLSRLLIPMLVPVSALLGLLACTTTTPTPTPVATQGSVSVLQSAGGDALAESKVSSLTTESTGPAIAYGVSQQTGIWVVGRGEVTAPPDLALLNAGVEAIALTVAEANSQASRAMDRIVQALKERQVQDRDIQTRFFNISPEYRYNDRLRQQELVGYRVSNQVAVKIRDLDNVGELIDEVAQAGGDLVRIQGVNFAIDDTAALEREARERAVQDALAKAQQFAQLTGVEVGPLVYISEAGGVVPRVESVGVRTFELAAAEVTTPISGGELRITTTVQVVFAIQ